MAYAQWKEKRGKSWSKPYWKRTKDYKTASKTESSWNRFDNPYDKLKLVKVRGKLPKGVKKNKYGTYR